MVLQSVRNLCDCCVCVCVCTGESMDEMRLLEEQARRIADEARKDKPKGMTFVK